MTGYHTEYLAATILVGLAALAKTLTYLLLQFFVDHLLVGDAIIEQVLFIVLGFSGLARLARFEYISKRNVRSPHCRRHHPPPAQLPVRPHPAPHFHYHADNRPVS